MSAKRNPTVVPGDPGRYAYARAERLDITLPPERTVETHLRSLTGVATGEIGPEALDGVTGFWLKFTRAPDFTLLAGLRKLEWLAVRTPADFDLAPLVDALAGTPVRSLHVEAPLTRIDSLSRLTGLDSLRLSHTEVTDLAPLSGLTGLLDISLCDGPLSDLSPLRDLTPSRLFVYRTAVTDLRPLAGMHTIGVLGLAGCPVADLAPLKEMRGLHHVNLHGTPGTDHTTPLELLMGGVGVDFPDDDDEKPAAQAGEPEPVGELLTRFQDSDDFTERHRLYGPLLASRDPAAVKAVVSAGITHGSHSRHSVVGQLLQGGRGDVPFPANPWGIRPDEGLAAALARLWDPIADLAPQFVGILRARTLGLVLLAAEDAEPGLGYLVWGCDEKRSGDDRAWQLKRVAPALDDLTGLGEGEYVRVITGSAPREVDPDAVVPILAGPVPRPLRDLWAVHPSLTHFWHGIRGELDENVLGFVENDWDEGLKRTGGTAPDRLVLDVGRGDFESYALDLDVLDAAGNPTVVCWHWKEWGTGVNRQFWDWLDDEGTRLAWL
ncbi:hypothetical protein [Phytomonospora endophytica]|uniref:Uncharacterized protein n=1 Tax=Phytomonospora endophytica TaxID=714109 RepID=A0A841FKB8_9ACTN|nr:hypothetical protein [Phytomonospora endophytica]MBB6033597.1 hypothetical protein [Phytomonospora endophytica]GIG64887.1 hypothetical protein Pen01_11820 [Phytomonospora endophytica]